MKWAAGARRGGAAPSSDTARGRTISCLPRDAKRRGARGRAAVLHSKFARRARPAPMSNKEKPKSIDESVEGALLDAELFVKYKAPQKAIARLLDAVAHHPRSVVLREKLREVAVSHERGDEAARQCLALVNLYLSRENFEAAHERLLEAKHIDPRINIAAGLEAIRRARRPDLHPPAPAPAPPPEKKQVTFAGDLSTVSIFDAVQVVENSRLTGALALEAPGLSGRVLFNEGRIVGAECRDARGELAFRLLVEITSGSFDFSKSAEGFPVTIQALSNTNLLLDTLRQLDEEKNEQQ